MALKPQRAVSHSGHIPLSAGWPFTHCSPQGSKLNERQPLGHTLGCCGTREQTELWRASCQQCNTQPESITCSFSSELNDKKKSHSLSKGLVGPDGAALKYLMKSTNGDHKLVPSSHKIT